MNLVYSSPVVVCRPALPGDTADVLEFTKFTWDGHDYVRYVWDEWLADPHGILAVAEFAGHAVGLAKVTKLAAGQWWLEGFRVDPYFQGRKIGSHIHTYIDGWWAQHGNGTARLMTGSQRVQVHHLCEKLGYSRIGEVTGFTAPPLRASTREFELLAAHEISEAVDFVQSSPSLKVSYGLIDLGWRFVTPNPETIQVLVEKKLAWWWRGRQGLLLAWEDKGETPEDERMLAVGLPASSLEALPDFLFAVRCLASQNGYASVLWIAPMHAQLLGMLEGTGFERKWENSGFLYEKRHADRP